VLRGEIPKRDALLDVDDLDDAAPLSRGLIRQLVADERDHQADEERKDDRHHDDAQPRLSGQPTHCCLRRLITGWDVVIA
jgi:hypothetical protein